MTFRKLFKYWLYGSCPGFAGAFPYFGTQVHFPRGSVSFRAACEQGIFEADNTRLLCALVEPGSHMFDVGGNIGLMAIPVLQSQPDCCVVSFEPSHNTLPWLHQTIAGSSFKERWTLIEKAVGATSGVTTFSLSDQTNSLYDGIRSTQRVACQRKVEVPITTLDDTWQSMGRPRVSVIKVDVEGGELAALQGARECLKMERPAVLLEWNRQNLAAYDCAPESLVYFASEMGFELFSLPNLVPITTQRHLKAHMVFTENFLLSPSGNS